MRYGVGNVVLVRVPHVRVMDGESEVLVTRCRSVEAEREVVGLIGVDGDGCVVPEPDWFVDRWMADGVKGWPEPCMVTVAVWEDADGAEAFRGVLAKGDGKCALVEDAEMAEREADVFSAAWEEARSKEAEKAGKAITDARKDGGVARRVLFGNVGNGEADEAMKKLKYALVNSASGCADPYFVCAMDREDGSGKCVVVGVKRKEFAVADTMAFMSRIGGAIVFSVLQDGEPDAGDAQMRLMCSEVVGRLVANDARREGYAKRNLNDDNGAKRQGNV